MGHWRCELRRNKSGSNKSRARLWLRRSLCMFVCARCNKRTMKLIKSARCVKFARLHLVWVLSAGRFLFSRWQPGMVKNLRAAVNKNFLMRISGPFDSQWWEFIALAAAEGRPRKLSCYAMDDLSNLGSAAARTSCYIFAAAAAEKSCFALDAIWLDDYIVFHLPAGVWNTELQ